MRMIWYTTLSFVMLITCGTLHAQPDLEFKRVEALSKENLLRIWVTCDGEDVFNMKERHFRVTEDGAPVEDLNLFCPDPEVRYSASVALVFDISSAMAVSGQTGAMMAGKAFVDLMDGVLDEAAVLWFDNDVQIKQQMTTIKPLLYQAVASLPASGSAAMWDAAFAGLTELINVGVNQRRAMILMSIGNDHVSRYTGQEVIQLANNNRIRIFTIGLGNNISADTLEMLAVSTGGRYYQTPNAGQLAAIYQEIVGIGPINDWPCYLSYERSCSDGAEHEVNIELVDFCGGHDSETKTYTSPLDPNTFSELSLDIMNMEVADSGAFSVPLFLHTDVRDQLFYPLSFSLSYDSTLLEFLGADAPLGTLLEGAVVAWTTLPSSGGMAAREIRILDTAVISGHGPLLSLQFSASDIPDDTLETVITALEMSFEAGCLIPSISPGRISLMPKILHADTPSAPGDFHIALYPNPAENKATLHVSAPAEESATVWLVGLLGRRSKLTEIERGSGGVILNVDLSSMPAGPYHIVVYSTGGMQTARYLKL